MSLYDYEASRRIEAEDYPFYALIMAAMRKADNENLERLKHVFPRVWIELKARYNAPGGMLHDELVELAAQLRPSDDSNDIDEG